MDGMRPEPARRRFRGTIGRKLFGAFGAMLALVFIFGLLSWQSQRQADRRLDEVLNQLNRKLDIGAQVELATTEMQGAQRGLMLSYAMKDPQASLQYVKLYADSGKKIDELLADLEGRIAIPAEREFLTQIADNRKIWAPRFENLLAVCQSGEIARAYTIRNENKLISAKMHAAATGLVSEERKALAEASATSKAAALRAGWITGVEIAISLALGAIVFVVVRQTTNKLRRALQELRDGASQVACASEQVSASSQQLARGASEQAAAVEQTSAATVEMTATTRQNADSSRSAAELMHRTAEAVTNGNQFLGQMEASMKEIIDASGQVGKIIQVIDGIAFQTNILALNAAVEAARAGAAGSGFAVVADEVRVLAQRSAEAARNTGTLIEQSIVKSRDGNGKLAQVASAIGGVHEYAGTIARLIDEVKSSSEEQARGIQQVTTAIGQIELVTQKTAAAAEETAAAGQEMNAQAATLHAVVEGLQSLVG